MRRIVVTVAFVLFVSGGAQFETAGASAHSRTSIASGAASSAHYVFPPGSLNFNADLSKCSASGGYWNWYYCNDPGHPFGCTTGVNGTCAEYGVDVYWDQAGATIYSPEAGTATASTCGDFSCWNPGNVTITPSSGPYRGVIRIGHVSPNFTGTISVKAGQAIATEQWCNDSCGWDPHIEFMYSPSGGLSMGAFTGGCTAPANPCGNRPPSDPTSAWSVLVAIENGSAGPTPGTDNGGSEIRGVGSNRCLDVTNGGTDNGSLLQLWDCNGLPQQHWVFKQGQLQVYGNYGQCLDANANNGGANGTPIQIWHCNGDANQQWVALPDGSLQSKASGRCLDAVGGGTADGTHLQLWDCHHVPWQRWSGPPIPNGGGPMQGLASGRCLDVTGASISPGARPQLYDCLRDPQQQWLLDGTQLRVYADKCLDVTGDGKLNGTPVQIWYCNGGEQQQWTWRIDGTIRSRASGRCLDAIGGGSTNGTKLQIWDCSGATWQSFFRFTDAALSPTRGKPGTKVVITGPHLRGTREVTFGDMRAHFVVHSNTKITATVPKGADSGPVTIETPQGPGRSRAAFNVK